jgi:predicted MFS family arabinose efflux permease
MTAAQAAAEGAAAKVSSKGYRAWLLLVLLSINVLNLADRQGMAITAPAIKADLRLSDTQLGLLMGLGFALFYSLMGLPVARMAERMSRTRIISVSVALFAVMAALAGTARGFWTFLACRVGLSVGDAGLGPPVASLLGDYFPQEKRASAMTIVWLGAPIGVLTGSVVGGWMAQTYGWRQWFFALSVPAIVVAVIAFLTLREPPRGLSDPAHVARPSPPPMMAVLKFLWAKRSFRQVLIGAGLAATGMNALGQFFARFLVANYHMGLAEAGRVLGLMSALAMASGLALGGFGVDWAGKFDRRWAVWAPAIGLVLAAPLFILGVAQTSVVATVLVLMAAHVLLFVYYTPTLAMAQNMTGPDMRASSAFLVSLVLGLVGIGLGPTLIGILSDAFARADFHRGAYAALCPGGAAPAGAPVQLHGACAHASAAGVRHAIMAMSLLFVWASAHYALAAPRLREDLDTHYAG